MLGLQNYVWISPGRRSHTKRKPSESFHVEVPYWRYVPINVIKRERFNGTIWKKSSIQLIEPGNWYCQRSGRDYLNDNVLQAAQPVPVPPPSEGRLRNCVVMVPSKPSWVLEAGIRRNKRPRPGS